VSTSPLADRPRPDAGSLAPGPSTAPWPRSRLRAYIALEAFAVALGYVVSVLWSGAPTTASRWGLVVAGAVAVGIPLAIKSRRELRQEAEARSAETIAIEADTKLRLVVGDVVTPIAEVVGKVHQAATETERGSLRGQLKQLIVEAVANLCDGERARATFFELMKPAHHQDHGIRDGDHVGRGGDAQASLEGREMRATAWFGRGDPPETVFTDAPDDRRGQEALLLVRFHDYLLVDDVGAETLPRGAEPRPGATYRSFISVAVFCAEENLGMLSVDAPEPFAFDETDLNVMRAMAQLLGAGLVDRR
jgi:GAF domain-containing protein